MTTDAITVLGDQHAELQSLFDRVSRPDEDRPAVLKDLLQTISAHVSAEKQLVVPVLRDRVEGGDGIADRLVGQHDEIEHLVTLLERRKVNSPDVPDLANQLLEVTHRHVQDATETVFSALRSALTAEELADLGSSLQSDEQEFLTHPHPHLPDSGPVAKVTRKVAALVDRQRDKTTDLNRSAS